MSIKLGIPSKGRLMKATFAWFAERGVAFERTGDDREYAARVFGVGGVDLALLSAGEIPQELASGRLTLGVTGSDVVQEKIPNWPERVEALAPLGFGQANLVIAVPKCWQDVSNFGDLDAVAAQFRKAHGFRMRIATKYHRLVRAALRDAGVADYQLVDSQGATEGSVANLTAEAIADITSSGATLEANHLKTIGDVIHSSQATLYQNKPASLSAAQERDLQALLERLGVSPR